MLRPTIVSLVFLLAACSSDPGGADSTLPPTTVPAATSTTATTRGTIPPFEEVDVELSEDGRYLVDSRGMALYRFTLDTDRTPTCVEECSDLWPPFYGDPVAGEGVDPDLAGNGERPDGSIQVTYGGFPLYFYSGDTEPGDTNGHGFNDVWFLVGPDGNPLEG